MCNLMVVWAQSDQYAANTAPLPPSAFQFIKYGENPVSEYTGIPNISIPIYTIKVDNHELPIDLTYHAGGIKVADEATWVGLGWDLSFGNITQIINDRDDLSNSEKMLPDYYFYPMPYDFPKKYQWPFLIPDVGTPIPSYESSGIKRDNPAHVFIKFFDFYVPRLRRIV